MQYFEQGDIELSETFTTMDDYINILEASTVDFRILIRPSIYLLDITEMHQLDDEVGLTLDQALRIARIFKERIGVYSLSKIDCVQQGKYVTTMDAVNQRAARRHWDPVYAITKQALEQLGFKRASECRTYELQHQLDYIPFSFESIKHTKSPFLRELTEKIFAPGRVEKWIAAGYELELM